MAWKRSGRFCIQVRFRGRFRQGKVSGSEGFEAKGSDAASKVSSGRFALRSGFVEGFWRARFQEAKGSSKVSKVSFDSKVSSDPKVSKFR